MFDWSDELDDLRCRPLGWLHDARADAVREQRRWRLRELAVTRVLDERGAVDDTLAAADGVSVHDARATLATARALDELPHVAAAAASGLLSDGQLSAVVQVADPGSDREWAQRAPACAPADLRRLARAQHAPSVDETRRRWESRTLKFWWGRQSGMLEGRFALPDLAGAEFESVVQQITERLRPAGGGPWEPWDRRAADALMALVDRAGGHEHTVAAGIVPKVVVNVPLDGPAEVAHGVFLSREQLEQLKANAKVEVAIVDGLGTVVGLSRSTTLLRPKVRAAVIARDGGCRWPGCETRSGLQVHHLVPESWGGTTDFANLATVCAPHHRRLVPHGIVALVGNPGRPDGLELVRVDSVDALPRSGPRAGPGSRAGP
ncbi:MAG: HNH endonuclease [Actinomycetes bacterium]